MIEQITVETLKARQASMRPFLLLDVRTREEWDEGRIPGAQLLLDIDSEEIESWDKNREIIFQCRSGGRSHRMAEIFSQRGFTNLFNLSGGILAWQKNLADG